MGAVGWKNPTVRINRELDMQLAEWRGKMNRGRWSCGDQRLGGTRRNDWLRWSTESAMKFGPLICRSSQRWGCRFSTWQTRLILTQVRKRGAIGWEGPDQTVDINFAGRLGTSDNTWNMAVLANGVQDTRRAMSGITAKSENTTNLGKRCEKYHAGFAQCAAGSTGRTEERSGP